MNSVLADLTPISPGKGVEGKINSHLNLLWISCDTEDKLLQPNRQIFEWLKTKEVN